MWHTTELIGAFKDITNRYGYGIYQNRKLSVAVCNDLLAEYDTEKNIVQMLFQAGLGETFIGVPYKNEQELKIGLSRVEKFLMDQAIESGVREGILDVVSSVFSDALLSDTGEKYKPDVTRSFSNLHFKMNLPVIKEFADRIEVTSKFIYTHSDTDVETILERCVITDRFGSEFTSHMDYTLLKHGKSKTMSTTIPMNDKKIFTAKADISFVFLCSNRKKIITSYKISSSGTTALTSVTIYNMGDLEYERTSDLVRLLMKVSGEAISQEIVDRDSVMDPTTNPVVAPVYTSSDIREYSDGLHKEILYLKQGKGKRYKIVNGSKLNKSDNGVYTYSFEMETEIHLPDDAPVVVELSGGVRAVGTVLSCEDFQLMLMLDRDIGDRVGSARMMVEPWKLLEALDKRVNSLNPNVNKLAIRLMEEGPKLTSSKDINKVPKGQEAAIKMLQQEDIVSIWGPPGTGKTHTMAEIAKDYIYQGKSVLIVSHSNVSVDGVIKQIIKNPDDRMKDYLKHGKILRFGYVRDNELAKHPYATSFTYTLSMCNSYATELDRLLIQRDDFRVRNKTHTDEYNKLELKIKQLRSDIRKEERRYVDKAQLIGTTISRATVDPMFEQRQFDLVMFDEVSMAYVPQVIAAAALARDKFLFVGDFRQLAPISQNPSAKILQVDIFSYLKIVDANGDMYYHPWLVMLNEQRRMYPEIAAFPNKYVYSNMLDNHQVVINSEDLTRIVRREPLSGDALNLIDLSGSYCAADKNTDGSRFNILSAVVSFCTAVSAQKNHNKSIGIITPYAAQTRLIRAMIKDYYNGGTSNIRCATVHQFQGSESDGVIFDAVESYPKNAVGVLMGKNQNQVIRLINVAVTRAKGKLITVANFRFWENVFKGTNHIFYRLLSFVKKEHHTIIDNSSKTLKPYLVNVSPDKMMEIHIDEQQAVKQLAVDVRKAKFKIVVSLPSGQLKETEQQIFELFDEADSHGIEVKMKSNEYKELPKRWQEYCVGTENATFPLIVIDDEIAWYGLPTAKWVFKVNKTDSLVTVVNAMVRIKGRNTIEMMKALTDLEVVEIGENKRPLTKKKGKYTAQEIDDSNDTKVKVPGSCGLAAFVEEKEFCPNCRKNMILTKGSKGTSYLRCSDKSCSGRKYLTTDLINWYISAKNVSCPRRDGGDLKGGLSKFGPYIKCSCGHYLKPDEI